MDGVRAGIKFTIMVAAIALSCGCGVNLPRLEGITRVEVVTGRGAAIKEISDPDRVRDLVAFVNARGSGWGPRPCGAAGPDRVLHFYAGAALRGSVGWGDDFFEARRDSRGPYYRSAGPEEVEDLVRLVVSEGEWRPWP